jgi:hypothetical protein
MYCQVLSIFPVRPLAPSQVILRSHKDAPIWTLTLSFPLNENVSDLAMDLSKMSLALASQTSVRITLAGTVDSATSEGGAITINIADDLASSISQIAKSGPLLFVPLSSYLYDNNAGSIVNVYLESSPVTIDHVGKFNLNNAYLEMHFVCAKRCLISSIALIST